MRYRITHQDRREPADPYDTVTIDDGTGLVRAVGLATAGLIQGYGPDFERFERVVGQDRLLVEVAADPAPKETETTNLVLTVAYNTDPCVLMLTQSPNLVKTAGPHVVEVLTNEGRKLAKWLSANLPGITMDTLRDALSTKEAGS